MSVLSQLAHRSRSKAAFSNRGDRTQDSRRTQEVCRRGRRKRGRTDDTQRTAKNPQKLKDRGFTLKLDTNGFESRMLEECLPYLDYVALDVKTSLQKYMSLGAKDTTELARTIEILKMGKIDYEFRTTVVPGLVDTQDIHAISELVKGAGTWALQQFVPGDTLDKRMDTVKPFPPETLNKCADTLKSYAERIVVRT